MQVGASLTDNSGTPWVIKECLGKGLWGQSFSVSDPDGVMAVLKVPLTSVDFPNDLPISASVDELCNACTAESARVLADGHGPRLLDSIELDDGRLALLLPRYKTLQDLLDAQISLLDNFDLVSRICDTIEQEGGYHGNLRPSNIFIDDAGNIYLADRLTASSKTEYATLARQAAWHKPLVPPGSDHAHDGFDAWSICLLLYLGINSDNPNLAEVGERLHTEGLSRVALTALKEKLQIATKEQGINSRFIDRASSKVSSLLNRGLSLQVNPSPPYRFNSLTDLKSRLNSTGALLNPRVTSVGNTHLDANAKGGIFTTDTAIQFSVSVSRTEGVNASDIATGVRVEDLDAPAGERIPIPGVEYGVREKESARIRFEFSIPSLPPGRYRTTIAFSIIDSVEAAILSTIEFQVRPGAGYIPQQAEPGETDPIPFPTVVPIKQGTAQHLQEVPSEVSQPSQALTEKINMPLPSPIPPSSPGVDLTVEESKPDGPSKSAISPAQQDHSDYNPGEFESFPSQVELEPLPGLPSHPMAGQEQELQAGPLDIEIAQPLSPTPIPPSRSISGMELQSPISPSAAGPSFTDGQSFDEFSRSNGLLREKIIRAIDFTRRDPLTAVMFFTIGILGVALLTVVARRFLFGL